MKNAAPATLCVHGGHRPSLENRSLVSPLVRGTAYLLDDEAYALRAAGRSGEAWIYAREKHPTGVDVERKLAALEGAEAATLFASGLATLHALLVATVGRGDRVVVARQLYGGSLGLLTELCAKLGAELVQADVGDPAAWTAAAGEGAALFFVESVSNPTLEVADLPRLAELAREAGAVLAVDATFATPFGQRPLEHGAHVVMHSATKYLGGHSDLVAGVLAADAERTRAFTGWRNRAGGSADPEAAWLLDRGLKTLHLRMRAHAENATRVAGFLEEHARVRRVLFPPADHPLLLSPGGMLAFVVEGGDEAALAAVRALELFLEAGTLGGVESLATVPATMSHVALSPEERLEAGIEPGLVRLSVGIEDADDLVRDLERALAQ